MNGRFKALAEETDLVCHVGALVNHVMNYQSLFAANVAGVAEIIRFALTARKKPIDFVSSVGVYPHLQYNTGGGGTAESLSLQSSTSGTRTDTARASGSGSVAP